MDMALFSDGFILIALGLMFLWITVVIEIHSEKKIAQHNETINSLEQRIEEQVNTCFDHDRLLTRLVEVVNKYSEKQIDKENALTCVEEIICNAEKRMHESTSAKKACDDKMQSQEKQMKEKDDYCQRFWNVLTVYGCNVNVQYGDFNTIEHGEAVQESISNLEKYLRDLISSRNTMSRDLSSTTIMIKDISMNVQALCSKGDTSSILKDMQEDIKYVLENDFTSLLRKLLKIISPIIGNYEMDTFTCSEVGQAGQKLIQFIVKRYGSDIHQLRKRLNVPSTAIENLLENDEKDQICCKMLFWRLKQGWTPQKVIDLFQKFDSGLPENENEPYTPRDTSISPAIEDMICTIFTKVCTPDTIETRQDIGTLKSKLDEVLTKISRQDIGTLKSKLDEILTNISRQDTGTLKSKLDEILTNISRQDTGTLKSKLDEILTNISRQDIATLISKLDELLTKISQITPQERQARLDPLMWPRMNLYGKTCRICGKTKKEAIKDRVCSCSN